MFACPRFMMDPAAPDPSPSPSLFSMARTKLQYVVGSGVKDSCSLHRWVLLKNSIYRSAPSDAAAAAPDQEDVLYARTEDEAADVAAEDEEVAFMFPDPDALATPGAGPSSRSENEWLDSLLETLCEDDGFGDDGEGGVSVSVLPADEDADEELMSPLYSPMSSSDDLVDQSSFYINPHAIPLPYPIPYPPLQPPLVQRWLDLDASSPLYDEPLPYYDADDDDDDLSVPDAIEDTSDDESDAPATPFDHSTSSLVDPASVPLPPERRRSDFFQPQVYMDDSYFYPFELDPLPPHHDDAVAVDTVYRPSLIQEC